MNIKISSVIVIMVLLFSAIMFFKRGFVRLQEGRHCGLDKMESWDKPMKSFYFAAARSLTTKPTTGLVKGIVYSKNKSSTVISDHNSIVYEDNTIYGATIVKIHKDKVEFAKNGQKWTQKVGETPSPEWYK